MLFYAHYWQWVISWVVIEMRCASDSASKHIRHTKAIPHLVPSANEIARHQFFFWFRINLVVIFLFCNGFNVHDDTTSAIHNKFQLAGREVLAKWIIMSCSRLRLQLRSVVFIFQYTCFDNSKSSNIFKIENQI